MRISTSEFLLGTLNDMLAQQANVNTLNREVASGQTMLDATVNPAGAGQAIGIAGTIGQLHYDAANAAAATETLQSGVGVLQQVDTVLTQLRQTAVQAANGTNNPDDLKSLAGVAQSALAQLVQLANAKGPDGNFLFAGSRAGVAPFSLLPDGEVVFNGDANVNSIEIAPSLSVPSSVAAAGVFTGLAAGNGGVAVAAAAGNTGNAYASAEGITSIAQVTAERLAGTQYAISFTAGAGGSLTYRVTSGTGAPGSAGFLASSGVVASGSFAPGSDLAFAGLDIRISGTPAAGDSFTVQPAVSTSIFAIAQRLVAALQNPGSGPGANAQTQQQIQNVIADLDGAQTGVLSAQATLGAGLAEIQAVQGQTSQAAANAQAQLSNLQSANLPQVLASYSEGVTALQAAQLAFARIQNLTLFSVIKP